MTNWSYMVQIMSPKRSCSIVNVGLGFSSTIQTMWLSVYNLAMWLNLPPSSEKHTESFWVQSYLSFLFGHSNAFNSFSGHWSDPPLPNTVLILFDLWSRSHLILSWKSHPFTLDLIEVKFRNMDSISQMPHFMPQTPLWSHQCKAIRLSLRKHN